MKSLCRIVVVLTFLSACSRQENTIQQTDYQIFEGKLDGDSWITMHLIFYENHVSGYYNYKRSGKPYPPQRCSQWARQHHTLQPRPFKHYRPKPGSEAILQPRQ